MLVSPSMSLVVAGVASGICFLIYSGILKGKPGDSKQGERQIPVEENRCSCCLRPFYVGRGARCKDCGAKSCRKGCSRWDPTDNAWHCLFCRQQRHWLKKNEIGACGEPIDEKDLHRLFNTARSKVYVAGVENAATSSGQGLAVEKEEANTMETVRDFVEKLVEGLIGNVDNMPINRLYDHPAYDKVLEKHITPLVDALTRLAMALYLSLKNKPSADSPTMAHNALREIVERAVEEARKLPSLSSSGGTGSPQEKRNVAEHSYEDLLATAILNKVIEKFQKEQVDGNSNVLHGKPVSGTKCTLSESEAGLDEGVEEGCSSLEPLSQDDCSSDCSASCSRRVRNQPEPLSLMIEERIEEVTTTYASDEDPRENDVLAIKNTHRVPFPELGMDIIDPSQESEDSQDEPDTPITHIGLVSPIESWEKNWLFQKKRVQTQADPVAMLVPNPSADFKALIGDKDAEDTSDLSECSSAQSDEEIEKELMEAINNVVPRSPKKKEFENGFDRYSDSTTDISPKQNGVKSYSRGIFESGPRKAGVEKTESRIAREQKGETKGKGRREENYPQSRGLNGNDEAKEAEEKETEKKLERVEMKDEKPVPETISVISNGVRKIEMKRQMTNDVSKEDKKGNSTNDKDLIKLNSRPEESELIVNNSSSSTSLEPSTVSLSEENVPDVPKTPTSTPTRTSAMEVTLRNPNEGEIFVSQEENVLNSLECAKKKLMEVNDDAAEIFEEDGRSAEQKLDFHAEDIQQESEYTEHYDIATQRHLDSLTKTEISELLPLRDYETEDEESKCREAAAHAKAELTSYQPLRSKNAEEEVRLATPPRPGTIAEREHKKWENAPPIENNPYSQENIQKRLWERQYSRRSSDIPGIHTELPKSNGADLDVVLTPHEPDIKRFGRDYYINDSRASGNEKGRRSAASTSSRPSSSLSQRSSSTGLADQDQQVSLQLEKFEEASLRGSLSRWTYRDLYSSPHFAINPLLHMELDVSTESADSNRENAESSNEKSFPVKNDRNQIKYPESIIKNGESTVKMDKYEAARDKNKEAEHFSITNGGCDEFLRIRDEENVDKCETVTNRNGELFPIKNEESVDKYETATNKNENSEQFAITNGRYDEFLRVENGKYETVMNKNGRNEQFGVTNAYNNEFDIDEFPINDINSRDSFTSNEDSTKVAYNPLFEAEEDILKPDGDSGTYSIDTNSLESKKRDTDCWRRLWINDCPNNAKNDQILLSNGRKYCNFNGYKYHTFGGIKNSLIKTPEDSDEDNFKVETPDASFDLADFGKMKFQTFGGIKKSKKVDGKGMPMYRRVILRSTSRNYKNSRGLRSSQSDSGLQRHNGMINIISDDNFDLRSNEQINYQSDDSTENDTKITDKDSKYFDTISEKKNYNSKPNTAYSSSYRSSSDDDWQDEDVHMPDKVIMRKFLRDATKESKKSKSRSNSDTDSSYFVNTSRRRIFDNSKRGKSTRQRSSDDSESLKLEPPIVPEVVEKSFETLQELRSKGRKKKHKSSLMETTKKLGVRSLTDLTIW